MWVGWLMGGVRIGWMLVYYGVGWHREVGLWGRDGAKWCWHTGAGLALIYGVCWEFGSNFAADMTLYRNEFLLISLRLNLMSL